MSRNSRPHRIALLVVSLLVMISSSCSTQDGKSGDGLFPGMGNYSGYLGFVDDPAGEPVAFADLGGTERSTWEGVASGDFQGYEGGWLPVESMGYATGYAYLHPLEEEFPFFVTTLTPFQSLFHFESNEPAVLIGFREDYLRVTAEVSPDIFEEKPAFVGLTAIDPLDVKPRYADTELEKGLRVQGAIALQAFDETWEPIDLLPDAEVEIRLEFVEAPSGSAAFALFDPGDGIWKALGPACASLDPLTYTCKLSSLTPLLAVFDMPAESAANEATHGSLLSSRANFQEGTGGGDGGVGGIIDQIEDWLREQQDQTGGADPNDPTLKNLIDQLIDQALDQASKNRTEGGKKALVAALEVVTTAGQPGAGDPLQAELNKISDEIGNKALQESDCGEFEKLLKAAEQISRFGGSSQLYDQLTNQASEMAEDCDIWAGHITVSLWVTSNHPSGLPMKGGGGSWMESHSVQIWTNVDDYVMHGESKVTYSFATASYEENKECKSEIKMSGLPGQTTIYFEGFYDGYTFQVNSVTPQGGATIKQHWTMRAKEDDKCETVYSQDFSFSPYYSLIVHGVSSDSPPINIQEILDSSSVTSTMGTNDSLSGTEQISNPDPDLGIYPFRKGFVTWNLMHRQNKLPREEN